MRPIPIHELLSEIFETPAGGRLQRSLFNAHSKVAQMDSDQRHEYLKANGFTKWSPVKDELIQRLGHKCWYTEAKPLGAQLTIDHYRPKRDYWWLAFEPENFRVACPYSNSPEHNEEHGCSGGKGDAFPLIGTGERATSKENLGIEKPVLLDPCKPEDCALVAFQADGRPVINPNHVDDMEATRRVETSKILLNLDHPAFNSEREQLYYTISEDVKMHEELPVGSSSRSIIVKRMEQRLSAKAQFSTAARHFLGCYRHLDWVESLLQKLP